MPDGDYYSVLGVSPEVSGSAIQAAYDRLKQQATDGQLPQSKLPAIDEAFQTLGDPIRRLRYDAQQSAPPPPRFQMPAVNLPGRRLRVGLPFRGRRLPGLPQVDPIVGGAVALVLAVAIVVALLFVTRGRGKPSAPAESVAGLISSPTATAATPPAEGAAPAGTAPSIIGSPRAGGFTAPPPQASTGGQGSFTAPPPSGQNPAGSPNLPPSLLPIGSAGSPLGQATAPAGIISTTGEPPFLTSSALVDMLRAVIAASAVRNAPPGGAPPAAAAAPASAPPAAPITSLPNLPPVVSGAVSAAAPSSGGGTTSNSGGSSPATSAFAGPNLATPPAAATQRPVPNHIVVPTGPVTASGSGQGATVAGGAAAGAPNRIGGPAATPGH